MLDGDRSALSLLYVECKYIATILLKSMCRKRRVHLASDQIADLSHDASARLVERIMRNHGYRVDNFRSMLHLEVVHAFTGGRRNGHQAEVPIPAAHEAPTPKDDDPREYLQDLIAAHPAGHRVVYDLARARSYRSAVHRIAEYAGRAWVREWAGKLAFVYRTLRVQA